MDEEGLDYDGLVAFLCEEETRSQDDGLSEERANALEFYNGEPYGDEEDGRSQVVTRDVAEVVDYMTVSLLRTLVSGDRVVEFEHRDTRMADLATLAVSRQFFQGQDGYRFLHDWIKAGLLEKSSTAKVCVEPQKPRRIEAEVSEMELAALYDGGAQVIAADDAGDGAWRVVVLKPRAPVFRDYVAPNEEFGHAADARDLDEDCVYLHFTQAKTLSQLAEMGFDTDEIGADDDHSVDSDALLAARDPWRGDTSWQGSERAGANRRVWYREEYCTYDLNGDGIAEMLQVHRVGKTILRHRETGHLAVEEIDQQPGVIWCPFPMQHRLVGQSLADKVMDIQRINSVVMRQTLDAFYFANNPRTYVNEGSIGDTTLDDLLTVRPGAVVRWTGGIKPEIDRGGFDPTAGIALLEKMTGEKESRTGITRLNQGLDADTLNKTATGTALMQAQGQQIEEYLARNFAEAFARLMLKKYRLMRQHGEPMLLQVDGEAVEVDPRSWPEDIEVQVRVGLGSGRKDQRIQYRQLVMQVQQAIAASESRVVSDENIWNSAKGLVRDTNLGNPSDFFTDPSTLPPAEPQPDPEMAKVEADAMLEASRQDADRVRAQADQMLKARQLEVDAELKARAQDADLAAKREKATLDAELARDKAVFEANLATQKAEREWELALLRLERETALNQQKAEQDAQLKKNRPGGELDK